MEIQNNQRGNLMNEITNIVEKPTLLQQQDIELSKLIYTIRGKQIMLDCDLTILYGYTVKRLNEQVKNNKNRFPEDFMFQMTREEVNDLRSKFPTANINPKSRYLPHVFTEQGIYMLATVLSGEIAEKQSIFIMRAFREMRHFISSNALLFERINAVELNNWNYKKMRRKILQKYLNIYPIMKRNIRRFFLTDRYLMLSVYSQILLLMPKRR